MLPFCFMEKTAKSHDEKYRTNKNTLHKASTCAYLCLQKPQGLCLEKLLFYINTVTDRFSLLLNILIQFCTIALCKIFKEHKHYLENIT